MFSQHLKGFRYIKWGFSVFSGAFRWFQGLFGDSSYPLTLITWYIIYSPTKVKHHLTCFNNIFSNNELISNRFAVYVTCTHILTYLWNRLLIDFYLCVYDRVCKVPRVLFNICVCERKLIFFVCSFKFYFLLVWYGAAKINHTRKVVSCWHAKRWF